MTRRLKNYMNYLEKQLHIDLSETEKEELRDDLLIQIGFFQHERLIHLIVTVTFAILALMSALCSFFYQGIGLFALILLFFALLIPYIIHYFNLENGVQKLYSYYDQFAVRKDFLL